jgi:hypothetical protein
MWHGSFFADGEDNMPAVIEMRHLNVAAFSRIEVYDGLDVTVEAGAAQRISVSASDSDMADRVVAEVYGSTLHLGFRRGVLGWLGTRRVSVMVAAPIVEGVRACGGSTVDLLAVPVPELELEGSGGSQLQAERIDSERLLASSSSGSTLLLAGQCHIAEFSASSGASIDAERLRAARVEGQSSSGSRISADADDGARVAAASGSQINLRAQPRHLARHTSSGGSVRIG